MQEDSLESLIIPSEIMMTWMKVVKVDMEIGVLNWYHLFLVKNSSLYFFL